MRMQKDSGRGRRTGMTELKPCPFCKGKARYCYREMKTPFGGESFYSYNQAFFYMASQPGHIECSQCGIKQPKDYSRMSIAKKNWNKRAGDE